MYADSCTINQSATGQLFLLIKIFREIYYNLDRLKLFCITATGLGAVNDFNTIPKSQENFLLSQPTHYC